MKAILGLGNPGEKYENTRHNIGFKVIDELLRRGGWSEARQKRSTFGGAVIRYEYARQGDQIVAIKPFTFMNESGNAWIAAKKDFGIAPEETLVIVDDVNLPFGRLRLRQSGSSGGQKGLQDILEAAGSEALPRLRMGVGRNETIRDLSAFVLSEFEPAESKALGGFVAKAADAIECWAGVGLEEAMNRFNAE